MNLTKTSKYLSLILRHKPETIGITLDEPGWANVDELIAGIAKTHDCDMDILEEIVRTDEKQRYSFNEDKTLIRANQGHSIAVDVELEEAVPPEELWHGTGEKYVESIDRQGLIPKTVCAPVEGQGHGCESGQPPWKAGDLSCEGGRYVPGWLSVLSVEKRRLADEEGAGGIFKKGLK